MDIKLNIGCLKTHTYRTQSNLNSTWRSWETKHAFKFNSMKNCISHQDVSDGLSRKLQTLWQDWSLNENKSNALFDKCHRQLYRVMMSANQTWSGRILDQRFRPISLHSLPAQESSLISYTKCFFLLKMFPLWRQFCVFNDEMLQSWKYFIFVFWKIIFCRWFGEKGKNMWYMYIKTRELTDL